MNSWCALKSVTGRECMHIGIFSPGSPSPDPSAHESNIHLHLSVSLHVDTQVVHCPRLRFARDRTLRLTDVQRTGHGRHLWASWCLVVLVCYLVWSFCVGPLGRVTINLPTSSTSVRCRLISEVTPRARAQARTQQRRQDQEYNPFSAQIVLAAGAGGGAAGQAQAAASWMKYGWSAGWSYSAKCSGFLR